MSLPNDENGSMSPNSQLSTRLFGDLLDSIIIDVASECHRTARLGLDRNLEVEEEEMRLSAEARATIADASNSGEVNGKYIVDIFGQTHPPIANDIFDCMNCGQSIMAGRFAPHLEKCMGKGRTARLKNRRSSRLAQNRSSRGNSVSSHPQNSSTSQFANDTPGASGEWYSNGSYEDP